jgi:hypothetical protein
MTTDSSKNKLTADDNSFQDPIVHGKGTSSEDTSCGISCGRKVGWEGGFPHVPVAFPMAERVAR